MGRKCRQTREELRRQRDEELSLHRPFPLISLAEWQARVRRSRIPLIVTLFSSIIVTFGLISLLGIPSVKSSLNVWLWMGILGVLCVILPILTMFLPLSRLSRHFGLCCPYCSCIFAAQENRLRFLPTRPYDERGRCPRCQRLIFSDWATEDGWEAVALRPREPRWDSVSTLLAMGVVICYVVVIFSCGQYLPRVIWGLEIQNYVFILAPAVAFVLWGILMYVRVFVLKERRLLAWTAVRWAVILLGTCVCLTILVFVSKYPTRGLDMFAERVKQQADVAALRSWAEDFQPAKNDVPTGGGHAFRVQGDHWPECVKMLKPTHVFCNPKGKRLILFFQGQYFLRTLNIAPPGTEQEEESVSIGSGIWANQYGHF